MIFYVGNRYHTAGSEPYFFDTSYTNTRGPGAIPVDLNGRCAVAEEIGDRNKDTMYRKKGTENNKTTTQRYVTASINVGSINYEHAWYIAKMEGIV